MVSPLTQYQSAATRSANNSATRKPLILLLAASSVIWMRDHGLHNKLGTAMMPSRVAIGASEPSPTATPATAMPSANPAAPARRWPTPLRSRSPLHLRHEIRQCLGLSGIGAAGVARATATKRTPIVPTAAAATAFYAKPRKVLRVEGASSYFSSRSRPLGLKGVEAGEPLRVEPDSHRRSSPELRRQFDWLG